MDVGRTLVMLLLDGHGTFIAVEPALAFALAPVLVAMAAEPDSLLCTLEVEPGEEARALESSLLPNQRRLRTLQESHGGQLFLSVSKRLSSY